MAWYSITERCRCPPSRLALVRQHEVLPVEGEADPLLSASLYAGIAPPDPSREPRDKPGGRGARPDEAQPGGRNSACFLEVRHTSQVYDAADVVSGRQLETT